MSSTCKKCGLVNVDGKFFCEYCGARLHRSSIYDLTVDDFITDGDREAFNILKCIGSLIPFLYSTIIKPKLQTATSKYIRSHTSPTERLTTLSVDCAEILALEYLPEVYVTDLGQKNAITLGDDSEALIVLDNGLQKSLSDGELRALLGHEMGHIKSRHLAYHVTAEVLERGLAFASHLTNTGILSLPVKPILLAWHRESELSADRASLIVAGDITHVETMFLKMIGEALSRKVDTTVNSVIETFSSHPHYLNRLKALREFLTSTEYKMISMKLLRKKMLRSALVEFCRFCGSSKHVEDVFCPSCGRALA
ncbi:MAG: M48 family metalloprotease [Candidatus Bathyarchaeia archaeon]